MSAAFNLYASIAFLNVFSICWDKKTTYENSEITGFKIVSLLDVHSLLSIFGFHHEPGIIMDMRYKRAWTVDVTNICNIESHRKEY